MTSRISRFHQKRDPSTVPSSSLSSSSFAAQKITNPPITTPRCFILSLYPDSIQSLENKKSKKRHRFRSTISHNHSIMSPSSSLLKTSTIVRKTMLVSRYLPRAAMSGYSTSSRHGNDPEVCLYIYIYFFSVLGSCCLSAVHAIDSSGLCMYLCLDSF